MDAGGATGEVEFVPEPMPGLPIGVLVALAGVPMFPVLPDCVPDWFSRAKGLPQRGGLFAVWGSVQEMEGGNRPL